MELPHFKPHDFVIFDPLKVSMLQDADLPPNKFYLVWVLEDKGDNFDFEVLDSGALAFCEAIAISACKKGQRIWFPTPPFGDSNS